jgi:hypothetical protein
MMQMDFCSSSPARSDVENESGKSGRRYDLRLFEKDPFNGWFAGRGGHASFELGWIVQEGLGCMKDWGV